jgi:hypothetical protein
MATFQEADKVRMQLKKKLINFSWYLTSEVENNSNDHIVIVKTSRKNSLVKKFIPHTLNGVTIKNILA